MLFKQAPDSICILRLSAIGDVCHAIAVVQAIQSHWPATKITWVVGKTEASLIQLLPDINVVIFDKKAGWQGVKAVWQQLKNQRFDALLHMQVALRASVLSLGIKARYRIGFSRQRAKEGQWLFTNKKIPQTESFHVLDVFADFARFIGVPFLHPKWHIPLPEADIHFAEQQLQHKPTLVISPAASKDERNWLSERYAAIADYAYEQGLQVLLCGSPAQREVELGLHIESLCQHPVNNLVGKTNLTQLTAVLKKATVVISPDSGPAHLATTQGTPVIGLYAHSNPSRTGPYNSQALTVSVYNEQAQRQYNKQPEQLPWGTRIKGNNIMQDITLENVKIKIDSIVRRKTTDSEK